MFKQYSYLLVFLLTASNTYSLDSITLHNETDKPVYTAFYWVPKIGGSVVRKSSVVAVRPKAKGEIQRPQFKVTYDRMLAYSTSDKDLPESFTSSSVFKKGVRSVEAGSLRGTEFWFDMNNGKVEAYSYVGWKLRKPAAFASSVQKKVSNLGGSAVAAVTDSWMVQKLTGTTEEVVATVTDAFRNKIMSEFPAYWKSPYVNTVASVRISQQIAAGEKIALNNRLTYVNQAITKKLGAPNRVPTIAVIASGGGYRAMILTLGFLVGAQKTNLLDSVTWISALSGSTWALASWTQTWLKNKSNNPDQFRERLFRMISNLALDYTTLNDIRLMSNRFLVDSIYHKPFTTVNMYGALIANRLLSQFDDEKQTQLLSMQADVVANGSLPLPIYTVVSGESSIPERHWYAFTPWEVSLEPWVKGGNGFSIPTWGLGRKYKNGTSVAYMPEQSLGFCMGCFGSAFAADLNKVYQTLDKSVPSALVRSMIDEALLQVGEKRLSWGAVLNFMKDVPGSPFGRFTTLKFVDAGLAFNLPLPPVSGMRADRKPDILIFMDGSGGIPDGKSNEFKLAMEWARAKGIALPPIDYAGIYTNSILVFKDSSNPSLPTIIYMPWVKDEKLITQLGDERYKEYGSIKTLNVQKCCGTVKGALTSFGAYSYEEAMQLSRLMEFNVVANADLIWEAIKEKCGFSTP